MRILTPLGALTRGLAAGAVGSGFQTAFFKWTAKVAPATPPGSFEPPEARQQDEQATETVARRVVEQLAQRPALGDALKKRAGLGVHVGFGSSWGGLYGLARETFPALGHPLGIAAYSTAVWMVSDNVLLPALRLGAPMKRYPPKVHLYAWLAHLAYGAGLGLSYAALRPQSWSTAAAMLWAARSKHRAKGILPRRALPAARAAIERAARMYAEQRPIFHSMATGIH